MVPVHRSESIGRGGLVIRSSAQACPWSVYDSVVDVWTMIGSSEMSRGAPRLLGRGGKGAISVLMVGASRRFSRSGSPFASTGSSQTFPTKEGQSIVYRRRTGGSSGGGAAGVLFAVSALSLSSHAWCFAVRGAVARTELLLPLRNARQAVSSRSPQLAAGVKMLARACATTRGVYGSAGVARRAKLVSASADACVDIGEMETLIPYERGTAEWKVCEQLLASIVVDEAETLETSQIAQGTPEWLSARKFRLTASNFGAALGHNKYNSPKALALEMLGEKQFPGNDATRWGSKNEPIARDYYISERTLSLAEERGVPLDEVLLSVAESGLHILGPLPFIAASPDGLVSEFGEHGVLEIKCPFSETSALLTDSEVPLYYIDQVQGIMAVLGYKWADFVVWSDDSTKCSIRRIPFDEGYWASTLLPGLKAFYRDHFLPGYVLQQLPSTAPPLAPAPVPAPPPKAKPASKKAAATPTPTTAPPASPQDNRPTVTRPKPVVSFISTLPLPTTPAPPAIFSGKGSGPPRPGVLVGEIVPVVRQLDVALRARGMRPEYVGSGVESLFMAMAAQLPRLGVAAGGAVAIKDAVIKHIRGDLAFYAKESGQTPEQLSNRLLAMSAGTVSPGAVDIMACARLYKIKVVCMILESSAVSSREFGAGGDASTAYLCTTGTFFWSTAPRPEGPTFPLAASAQQTSCEEEENEEEGDFTSQFSIDFQEVR